MGVKQTSNNKSTRAMDWSHCCFVCPSLITLNPGRITLQVEATRAVYPHSQPLNTYMSWWVTVVVLQHALCCVFPCQCPPCILMASLFISCHYCSVPWFILSFASLEQPPLAHFLDELGFFSSALWLTNDFVKSDMVSCRKKKEQKLNPGLCQQSHLSSFQYWCPLCLWIIWLSSVLWPSSPCQIGHLGHRPVDNVILTDGFHSLIVSTVFL